MNFKVFDKVVYLLQVSREVYLSAFHKLGRCFALIGQKHQVHLKKVSALKEGHKKEVKEVSNKKVVFFFNKISFEGSMFNFKIVFKLFCNY